MKLVPRTLLFRLLLTFWTTIALFAAFQYFVLARFWSDALQEIDQRMYWGVASSFAAKLQPILKDPKDVEKVKEELYHFSEINPRTDVYLLSKTGDILISLPYKPFQTGFKGSPTDMRVDTKPIVSFLKVEETRKLPVLGTSPTQKSQLVPFSVAPVMIHDKPGYLYIVLQGRKFFTLVRGIEDYYAILWGSIALGLLLACSMILGTTVLFFITKRFRAVTTKVNSIAAGNFDTRIEVSGEDEIGRLASNINTMAETIIASLRKSEKTDEMRRELVANISHDLGAPLGSAEGYLETLLNDYEQIDDDKRRERVNVALRNVQKISRMIRELFELSKLEAKETKPQIESFSLEDMVYEEIIPKYQLLAQEKGINLEAKITPDASFVNGDVTMVERVISNLVENAIRYHDKANGNVIIRAHSEKNRVNIEIEDNGMGIPKQEVEAVFNRFYRGNDTRAMDNHGTGLGLAIVKEMLESQGSKIHLLSVVGEGTTFSFSLQSAKIA